jgi:hypothetical protein
MRYATSTQNGRIYVPYNEVTSTVLGPDDSIMVCHAEAQFSFIQQEQLVSKLILAENTLELEGSHAFHPSDIIPPFFYDLGTQLFLYSGKNWTQSNQDLYNRSCKDSAVVTQDTLQAPDLRDHGAAETETETEPAFTTQTNPPNPVEAISDIEKPTVVPLIVQIFNLPWYLYAGLVVLLVMFLYVACRLMILLVNSYRRK